MVFAFLRYRLFKDSEKLASVYNKDRKPDLRVRKNAFL